MQALGGAEAVWAMPEERYLITTVLESAVRLPAERAAALAALGGVLSRPDAREAHSLPLALLEAQQAPPAEDAARLLLGACGRAQRRAWAAAPAGAARLRHALVAGWQEPAELSETLYLISRRRAMLESGRPPPPPGALEAPLVASWLRRWPSAQLAPRGAVEAVTSCREACIRAMACGAALEPRRRALLRSAGRAARKAGSFDLSDKLLTSWMASAGVATGADIDIVADQLKGRLGLADAVGAEVLASDEDALDDLLTQPLRKLRQRIAEAGADKPWLRKAQALQGAVCLRLARIGGAAEHGRDALRSLGAARALALAQLPAGLSDGAGSTAEARRAAKAMLQLAQLLDEALAEGDGAAPAPCWLAVLEAAGGAEDAKAAVVANTLRACGLAGSRLPHARSALPRLVSLLSDSQSARVAFATEVSSVPLWLFLPWATQMLGALGGAEADVLTPVLCRLAAAFPRALCLPIRLAAADGDGASLAAQRARELMPLASSPATERFAAACRQLAFPHKRLERYITHELRVAGLRGINALRAEVRALAADVADPAAATAAGAGRLNILFATMAQRVFEAHLGPSPDFPQLSQDKLQSVLTSLRFVNGVRFAAGSPQERYWNEATALVQPNAPLHAFSSFLADLTAASFGDDDWVEVPGQYAQAEARGVPPEPERHVRLVGCAPTLAVVVSKELPSRLRLLGDDGRESPFLCKSGDDLRQDASIMRLFHACNGAMSAHAPANARSLAIPTYHVEPLSQRGGLVAWIPHATTLLAALEQVLPSGADAKCFAAYASFVSDQTGGATPNARQGASELRLILSEDAALPAACAAKLRELHAYLGRYALRDALLRRCGSPEAFVAARSRCVASLIAGAAGCFVAGVGDRHLGNVMLCDSGEVVHIDYGYAFGQSSLLAVPELFPVRLTRAMTEAAAPLDSSGLLQSDLAAALQALHLARAPLLAALEAFARQPRTDWEQAAAMAFGGGADAPARLIALRIAAVRAKLNLGDPVAILLRNLAPKYPGAEQQRALTSLLTGDSARGCARTEACVRARARGGMLASTREQAEVLLDISADSNILMRTYRGWRPWL